MKNLFTNLWEAPASSIAGGIGALCLWLGSDAVAELTTLPPWVIVSAGGVSVVLGAIYGPKSTNQ